MVERKGRVSSAASKGRLATLKAIRLSLAEEIDAAPKGRSMTQTAMLAKQLRETMVEIEKIEALVPKGSVVDDLARVRKARRSGSSGSGPAVGVGGDVGP